MSVYLSRHCIYDIVNIEDIETIVNIEDIVNIKDIDMCIENIEYIADSQILDMYVSGVVYPYLRAIPPIHERNAPREVLPQRVGKFLYQTSSLDSYTRVPMTLFSRQKNNPTNGDKR